MSKSPNRETAGLETTIVWHYLESDLIQGQLGETLGLWTRCLMGHLKLYLDPLAISPFVLYGEEDFPQALTPNPQIFLKGWAVSQYFQYITRSHLWGLDSDL
jgi:hypothetical protein